MTPQEVTVSGTLTDSSGAGWNGATIIVQFVPGFGTPMTEYTWNDADFTKRLTMQATGNTFSVTLPSNDTILPIDSMWQFVISGNSSTPAVVVTKTLDYSVSPTLDISSDFTTIAPPLVTGPGGGGGGGAVRLIQVSDEATAISQSTADPNNIYFWI